MGKITKGEIYESEKLKSGFKNAGINTVYSIVFSGNGDVVETTALKMLEKMLKKAGLVLQKKNVSSGGKEIILGKACSNSKIAELVADNTLKIGKESALDDAFEIKRIGDTVIIAGSNGRGVLYGVYDFEDYIFDGAKDKLDRFVKPEIRKRSHAIGYYWNKYQGMIHDEFSEEKAEFMSRLRINQYHAIQDGAGYGPHLFNLVKSPVIPAMRDPDPEYVRKTKNTSKIMKEYGIDYFQWLIEPILPYFAGNIKDYPKDAFGKKSPPDWYAEKPDGIEKTLCINTPIVQEYFYDAAKRFAEEYPDVKGVFLYNNDCQAWFCEPSECEKCQKAAIDPIGSRHLLWENEMRIQNIINDGLHAGRKDMESLFWPTVHFSADEVKKLIAGTHGYTAVTTGWDGEDHDAITPACFKEPNEKVKLVQQLEKDTGIPLYFYFSFNRNECLPQGFPYPYHMAYAIKKFYSWGIRNFVEGTGVSANCNPINALAMKVLETDPEADIDAVLKDICDKQFKGKAGELMLEAFRAIRDGMNVWDENNIHPFRGSSNHLGMGPIMHFPPSINLDKDDVFRPYMRGFAENSPYIYKDGEKTASKITFEEQLVKNAECFYKAAQLAKQAVEAASDSDYIDYEYYDVSDIGCDRPTCKEYAEMNYSIIYMAALFCKEKVDKLRSAKIYFKMEKADEKTKEDLIKDHVKLVKDDIVLQKEMLAMFEDFKARSPQLTRVGITKEQVDSLVEKEKQKIGELYEYLDKYDK